MVENMEWRNNNSIGAPKNAAKYDKDLYTHITELHAAALFYVHHEHAPMVDAHPNTTIVPINKYSTMFTTSYCNLGLL